MPDDLAARANALRLIGWALAACEKTMQRVYEDMLRPAEKRHEPWVERVQAQLRGAYDLLEASVAGHKGEGWLLGERMMLPDITVAIAWRFTQYMLQNVVEPARYPALVEFSARAEATQVFVDTPLE